VVTVRRGSVKIVGTTLKLRSEKEILRTQIFFEAPDGIRVDGRLFLGRVSVQARKGKVMVINRLPLETYLLGIVGSEMNPDWPLDALKAQAVAARSYALQRRMMMRFANRRYDLESTVLSQVYRGAERISASVIDAVSLTRGEVLTHEHRLVEALFHSTCGGRTHSAREAFGNAVPYLRSRQCRWCKDAKRYRWTAEIELKRLEKALKKKKLINGRLESLSRKWGTRKATARVGGKSVYLSPRAIRVAIGYTELYSAHFEASTDRGKIRFKGRGFGHGVGLCQWGAHGLSKEGHNYFEILAHYYKGAKVTRIY
jgi:stage II sporulation protein D